MMCLGKDSSSLPHRVQQASKGPGNVRRTREMGRSLDAAGLSTRDPGSGEEGNSVIRERVILPGSCFRRRARSRLLVMKGGLQSCAGAVEPWSRLT